MTGEKSLTQDFDEENLAVWDLHGFIQLANDAWNTRKQCDQLTLHDFVVSMRECGVKCSRA